MDLKLQPLRGTKDLLPGDFKVYEHIVNQAKHIGSLYGYEPMSTPIIEYRGIFDRTLGDSSDIVNKEIYGFTDKGSEEIALRPEFTAGIARAFISNKLTYELPLKYFSSGPLFRYDRPQAGRQRQLHQVNFEYLGAIGPYSDAEVICTARDLLQRLEIESTLELNSLGCQDSRIIYGKKLFEYFNDHKSSLSEDSIRRLAKNPLRILDSKDENDKIIIQNAPLIHEYYTDISKKYFDDVLNYLELLKVEYHINPRLVRGLDYYGHTAFEFTTTNIGAQSALIGGGRYDGLIKMMGGVDTPAIGFAAGIERLALMKQYQIENIHHVIIMPLKQEDLSDAVIIAHALRKNNIPTIIMEKGKLDKRLSKAVSKQAPYAIFVGEEERSNKKYKLKNLKERIELTCSLEEIINLLLS